MFVPIGMYRSIILTIEASDGWSIYDSLIWMQMGKERERGRTVHNGSR